MDLLLAFLGVCRLQLKACEDPLLLFGLFFLYLTSLSEVFVQLLNFLVKAHFLFISISDHLCHNGDLRAAQVFYLVILVGGVVLELFLCHVFDLLQRRPYELQLPLLTALHHTERLQKFGTARIDLQI